MKKEGAVQWFDRKNGYGFIADLASHKDYFVHYSALVGLRRLHEDDAVEFEVGQYNGREVAVNVRVIADAPAVRGASNGNAL